MARHPPLMGYGSCFLSSVARRFLVGIAGVVALTPVAHCLSARQALANDAPARFYIEGMVNSLMEIKSGDVRIHQKFLTGQSAEVVELHLVFDYPSGSIRCDQVIGGRSVQVAKTRTNTLFYVRGRGMPLTIYPAGTLPNIDDICVFDVRIAGHSSWGDVGDCTEFDPTIVNQLRSLDARVDSISDGIASISSVRDAGLPPPQDYSAKQTLQIDGNRGFLPVSRSTEISQSGEAHWKQASESKTQWTRIGGCWVPTVWSIKDLLHSDEISVRFDWESVNSPVPASAFTVDGFDLPEGTLLVDQTAGRPILKGAFSGHPFGAPRTNSILGFSPVRFAIVAGNILMLLALVAAMALRRRRAIIKARIGRAHL
jgi:hypothetical protein